MHEFSEAVTADRPDQAPVLTYDLLGIADGPGVTPYERIADLERHPLSMELTRNQVRARSALVGNDERAGLFDDLATVFVGVDGVEQAREAAEVMNAGWLLDVLSWPHRFMADAADLDDAASPPADDSRDIARADARDPSVRAARVKEAMLAARPPGSRRRRKRA